MGQLKKEKHIEGLRSFAVLGVVVYHYEIPFLLKGGYKGVDVFFVISGYVITLSLLRSLKNGQFSYKRFIEKRFKRLFPALLCTILATNIAVLKIFTTSDINLSGKSALYSICSVSNIHFWLSSNYFDISSKLKPFLHTWSLSIEWQFYSTFPFVLRFIYYKPAYFKTSIITLILISAFSLITAEYYLYSHKEFVFYNILPRYFEFLIGCIAALLRTVSYKKDENGQRFHRKNNLMHTISVLSFVALVFDLQFANKPTRFPGFAAFSVCVSTCFLILFSKRSCIGIFLSTRILVKIGSLSYAIYLIHWPLIVITDYYFQWKTPAYFKFLLLFSSLGFGYLIHIFIELPFNTKIMSLEKKIFLGLILFAACISSLYSATYKLSLKPVKNYNTPLQRMQRNTKQFEILRNMQARMNGDIICHLSAFYPRPYRFLECNPPKKYQIFLIGDSHAADFWYFLNYTYAISNVSVVQYTASDCSIRELFDNKKKDHCFEARNNLKTLLSQNQGEILGCIIVSRWHKKLQISEDSFLSNTVQFLKKELNISNIFIIGPRPEYDTHLVRHLELNYQRLGIFDFMVSLDAHLIVPTFASKVLESFCEESEIYFYSPITRLCQKSVSNTTTYRCKSFHGSGDKITLLYSDQHHFNLAGSRFILENFLPKFESKFRNNVLRSKF